MGKAVSLVKENTYIKKIITAIKGNVLYIKKRISLFKDNTYAKKALRLLKENTCGVIALGGVTVIILLMLMPNIFHCVSNGARSRHLSGLYRINYALNDALEDEAHSGYNEWYDLIGENNSEKLLREVSSAFFGGRLRASDYYAENDGVFLRLSSLKYPEMQTLKIKIPEQIVSEE